MDIKQKLIVGQKICTDVYNELVQNILDGKRQVKYLCKLGDTLLENKIKDSNCNYKLSIAIPVSISLNNCVGYYIYEQDNNDYNNIKDTDIVKIEFGINVQGHIVVKGETLVVKSDYINNDTLYIDFLDDLEKQLVEEIKHGVTNDDVRMYIEAKCIEHKCFPIENCVSYQQKNGCLKNEESKYIKLNHRNYWDEDDMLAVEEDICFDLEEGEIYNINLTICPTIDEEIIYKERHPAHLYMFNDFYVNLKTRSGRSFLSKVKGKVYGNNVFVKANVIENAGDKLGFRECEEKGLIEEFPVLYTKPNVPVYHKKFTIQVPKGTC